MLDNNDDIKKKENEDLGSDTLSLSEKELDINDLDIYKELESIDMQEQISEEENKEIDITDDLEKFEIDNSDIASLETEQLETGNENISNIDLDLNDTELEINSNSDIKSENLDIEFDSLKLDDEEEHLKSNIELAEQKKKIVLMN